MKRLIAVTALALALDFSSLSFALDYMNLYTKPTVKSKIQAWNVTDPEKPKLHDVVIPGLHPNMMHLTYDGKRMYVTNSVSST